MTFSDLEAVKYTWTFGAAPWYMQLCLGLVFLVAVVMLIEGATRLWRRIRGR